MESSRKLWGSSGSCRYTVKAYPSYRFSPSSVPNHMNPRLSCKMLVTVLWESPSSVEILSKRIPEEMGTVYVSSQAAANGPPLAARPGAACTPNAAACVRTGTISPTRAAKQSADRMNFMTAQVVPPLFI